MDFITHENFLTTNYFETMVLFISHIDYVT